jgi:hypothetical protein
VLKAEGDALILDARRADSWGSEQATCGAVPNFRGEPGGYSESGKKWAMVSCGQGMISATVRTVSSAR